MIIKEKEMIKRPKQKFWSWIAYNRQNLQQGRGYEERIIDLEHRNFVLQKRGNLNRERMMSAYVIYGYPSKKQIAGQYGFHIEKGVSKELKK